MKSQFCIECGRELNEYISETLHICTICESAGNKRSYLLKKMPSTGKGARATFSARR
ncbi:hypothetical protein [Ammoniphilus resinae]|uniref:Ribosomal protein L37AE/L43A n=1 Tax=Ammoniphilus resinae TaxID=861532 RepID=A0ABS4GXP2_9BACL|nr:hypothetical protein [Ammoniphilus resinae]MBP1935048.1 ribosomal protein L37AE/L43A [Ammoniphilus resinae]